MRNTNSTRYRIVKEACNNVGTTCSSIANRHSKRYSFNNLLFSTIPTIKIKQEAIARIDARLNAYKTSLDKTIDSHLAPVDGALLQLQCMHTHQLPVRSCLFIHGVVVSVARAHRFIDSELSLSNAVSLLNSSGVQERFEKNVVQVRCVWVSDVVFTRRLLQ